MPADAGTDQNGDAQAALHAALANVKADMPAVPRNGRMSGPQGTYDFVRVDDILTVVRPIAARHGITVVPHGDRITEAELATSKGGTRRLVKLERSYLVVHAAGGTLTAHASGEAADSQDKALPKAQTAALKDLWRQMLDISTGEAEADHVDHDAAAAPPPGLHRVTALLTQADQAEAGAGKRIADELRATFRTDRLGTLTDKQVETAVEIAAERLDEILTGTPSAHPEGRSA